MLDGGATENVFELLSYLWIWIEHVKVTKVGRSTE